MHEEILRQLDEVRYARDHANVFFGSRLADVPNGRHERACTVRCVYLENAALTVSHVADDPGARGHIPTPGTAG